MSVLKEVRIRAESGLGVEKRPVNQLRSPTEGFGGQFMRLFEELVSASFTQEEEEEPQGKEEARGMRSVCQVSTVPRDG